MLSLGRIPGKHYSKHRLLLGTHTSSNDANYVQIASVQLPNPVDENDPSKYDDDREEIGGYSGGADCRLTIDQKIVHPGEVNKARHMPKNPDLIATMAPDGTVLIFDRTKHPLMPTSQKASPQIILKGHAKEGYGLAWNPHKEHELITGAEDATVRIWDTNAFKKTSNEIEAKSVYTHHSAIVNDVQFHPVHEHLFGSVSDDLTMQIVDTRSPEYHHAAHKVKAHDEPVNGIAFNPASDFVVATASTDKTIGLWDIRNIKSKLHSLSGHTNDVIGIQWSPHEEPILASSSGDRRIIFWDLSRIGEEQSAEDAEDGPPEM